MRYGEVIGYAVRYPAAGLRSRWLSCPPLPLGRLPLATRVLVVTPLEVIPSKVTAARMAAWEPKTCLASPPACIAWRA